VVAASKRGGLADSAELAHQLQPDGLADVVGVGVAEAVLAADGPDQRGVALDEGIPCLFVTVSGAGHQVSHLRVIAYRVGHTS
jgi:hypothetical protein